MIELQSTVMLTKVSSDVDDDYRTLSFRITEYDYLRTIETDEPRILES